MLMDNTKSKYLIVSYPRSGSNYFQLAWKQKNKQHARCIRTSKTIASIPEDNFLIIIGLIRNPIDAVSSRILISQTHETFFGTEQDARDFAISEYIKIYQFILDKASFIVDLSNFDQIDRIIETISNLDSNPINKDQIVNSINAINNYSSSFVEHKDYEKVKNILKSYDLEACNDLYNRAYQKRLMV
jgi:hypothetical protein